MVTHHRVFAHEILHVLGLTLRCDNALGHPDRSDNQLMAMGEDGTELTTEDSALSNSNLTTKGFRVDNLES
jgi:hypothetical protein